MLLSVHPLVSGAIMTICYVLSNLNNNIETFSFVYDNGTDVLVRRPSENPNPMATLADLWVFDNLPNGTATFTNLETGRRLSLNVSDILGTLWNVHYFTGDLPETKVQEDTPLGCCYNITQSVNSTLSPFPTRIDLEVDPNGILTTKRHNATARPPPGLWFLRHRPAPQITTLPPGATSSALATSSSGFQPISVSVNFPSTIPLAV